MENTINNYLNNEEQKESKKLNNNYLSLEEIKKKGLNKNDYIYRRRFSFWIDLIIILLLFILEVLITKEINIRNYFIEILFTIFLFLFPFVFILIFNIIKKQSIGEIILGIKRDYTNHFRKIFNYLLLFLVYFIVLGLINLGIVDEYYRCSCGIYSPNIQCDAMCIETIYPENYIYRIIFSFIIAILTNILFIFIYKKTHEKIDKKYNIRYRVKINKFINFLMKLIFLSGILIIIEAILRLIEYLNN